MSMLATAFGLPAASAPSLGHVIVGGLVWPHLMGASLLAAAFYQLSRKLPRSASYFAARVIKRPPTPPAPKTPPQSPLHARKGMLMVGHRGLSDEAPENTLAAIRLAFAHGAEGVEFDVQRSKDGELFLLHDDTLRRTAAPQRGVDLEFVSEETYQAMLDKDVSELSYWDFVRHVNVGSRGSETFASERPCLLREVVAEIPDGRFALCEIKGGDEACARDIAEFVAVNAVPEDKLTFIGFDFELMVLLKRLLVEVGKGDMQVISLKDAYTEVAALEHIAVARQAGLDGADFEADASVVTPRVVDAAKDADLHLGVWIWKEQLPASDRAANVATFSDIGVTFFTSDMPPDVRAWMAESSTASPCSSCASFK